MSSQLKVGSFYTEKDGFLIYFAQKIGKLKFLFDTLIIIEI